MTVTLACDLSYSAEMGHVQTYGVVEVIYEHCDSRKARSTERYPVRDRLLAFSDRRTAVRSRDRPALWLNRPHTAREGADEFCICHARHGAKCNSDGRRNRERPDGRNPRSEERRVGKEGRSRWMPY